MSGHRARKRFGQHFLRDTGVIERIVAAFAPKSSDHTIEIGPGDGALTGQLAGRVARLDLIELDRDLVARLKQRFAADDSVTVHQGDALSIDLKSFRREGGKLRLIGNLPYNISTPLLFHVLDQAEAVGDMLFMLQDEVVERMQAAPGGKAYGRLSVMVQWRARVEKLFTVPPAAFSPPPRVNSAVVWMIPHALSPVDVGDAKVFTRLVQAAFSQRRKTLRNSLKSLLSTEAMAALGIDTRRRAETLDLREFAALSRAAHDSARELA